MVDGWANINMEDTMMAGKGQDYNSPLYVLLGENLGHGIMAVLPHWKCMLQV